MKCIIVGCGRVGSTLAENLDRAGHQVVIFDLTTAAFDRLPDSFKGTAIRGDGTDEEVLRQGGADGADIFLALTEGDNRNIMAAQLASETLGVPRVIAKINDPVRADAYASLGLATLCRTNLMVDSVSGYLGLGMKTGPGLTTPTGGHDHSPDDRPTERPDRPAGSPRIAEAAGVRTVSTAAAGDGIASAADAAEEPQPPAEEAQPPAEGEAAQNRESRGFRFRRG